MKCSSLCNYRKVVRFVSYYGSEKEFILSMFLKKYPETLENILGIKLSNIELEIPYGKKKIDYYAVSREKKLEIFVENQLAQSDKGHLNEKIMPLLSALQEGYVVWIASSFKEEHVMAVKSFLKSNPQKYVSFYGVELHPEVLVQLEKLNSIYKLDVYWNLNWIQEIDHPPIKVVWKHEQIPSSHLGRVYVGESKYDFGRAEDVKDYVLNLLRKQMPNFLNLHKSKKYNQGDRTITLGGGKAGISYRVSVKDRRNLAFVEILFDEHQTILYKKFVSNLHDMKEKIHSDITIRERGRKIGVYFMPDLQLDANVIRISGILEKMISYFSPFLYNGRVSTSPCRQKSVTQIQWK